MNVIRKHAHNRVWKMPIWFSSNYWWLCFWYLSILWWWWWLWWTWRRLPKFTKYHRRDERIKRRKAVDFAIKGRPYLLQCNAFSNTPLQNSNLIAAYHLLYQHGIYLTNCHCFACCCPIKGSPLGVYHSKLCLFLGKINRIRRRGGGENSLIRI